MPWWSTSNLMLRGGALLSVDQATAFEGQHQLVNRG